MGHDTVTLKFTEQETESLSLTCDLEAILFKAKSEFQDIVVVTLDPFGKTLILDGKIQSSQIDEYIYHESLIHPAMASCVHTPTKVFIGGGGELASAREVLRHDSVTRCVMVDLDKVVVDVSRKELPEWGGEKVATDPRLELHYEDALKYLENTDELFDVIIMDIADPIEAGPGVMLYTKEFYEMVATKLSPGGVFVTQSTAAGLLFYNECFTVITQTLRSAFDTVESYSVEIPSFATEWGFNTAYNGPKREINWSRLEGLNLRHFDEESHRRMFALSKTVREGIAEETRIMTKANPIFMF